MEFYSRRRAAALLLGRPDPYWIQPSHPPAVEAGALAVHMDGEPDAAQDSHATAEAVTVELPTFHVPP